MACLTITVDADVLERAHMQAAITGVPVKDVVRQALVQFAEGSRDRHSVGSNAASPA